MDPVTKTMTFTHMQHFQALLNKMGERIATLRLSGFRTESDNKELAILEDKMRTCDHAFENMKKNPPSNHYETIDIISNLSNYVISGTNLK